MTQSPDWIKWGVDWARVRRREVELATTFEYAPNLTQGFRLTASREMLDDVKQASGIEGPVDEGQAEDRTLHEFGAVPRLCRADYYAVDADVISKAFAYYKRGEPARRAADVQDTFARLNEVGALLYTTLQAYMGANRQRVCMSPLYLHTLRSRFSMSVAAWLRRLRK